ncbi:MAG: hypothetical protein H6R26_3606, partial [Proteobacteria bacterium]|nr:hypothetical protein [Pseudomonadota bacterium]
MTRKSKTPGSPGKTDVYRAVLMALALLPAGCNREDQQAGKAPPAQPPSAQSAQPAAPQAPASAPQAVQTPAAPAPAPAAKPLTDLESLVAP